MIHPEISRLINLAKKEGYDNPDKQTVLFLASQNASITQATFVLNQGYGITLDDAFEAVRMQIELFKEESLEDSIYETFLYENYNPDDPKFKADGNMIRFSMKKKDKD